MSRSVTPDISSKRERPSKTIPCVVYGRGPCARQDFADKVGGKPGESANKSAGWGDHAISCAHDQTIDFTPELLAKLKRAYHDAVAEGRTAFRFEGHILIVQYAAFL